jgi:hypothetical protein
MHVRTHKQQAGKTCDLAHETPGGEKVTNKAQIVTRCDSGCVMAYQNVHISRSVEANVVCRLEHHLQEDLVPEQDLRGQKDRKET